MYYPLSKIVSDLYTSGNEFYNKNTHQDYKGYYFSTYDGKFFSEKVPSNKSVELLKYAHDEDFTTLASQGYGNKPLGGASMDHYIPQPTDSDYSKGYIIRYFVKRVNGDTTTLREVSAESYNELKSNPLYLTASLTWIIKGKLEGSYMGGTIVLPGVLIYNDKAVKEAERIVTGLSSLLRNLAQFHK
jgi:hypothetical protein